MFVSGLFDMLLFSMERHKYIGKGGNQFILNFFGININFSLLSNRSYGSPRYFHM